MEPEHWFSRHDLSVDAGPNQSGRDVGGGRPASDHCHLPAPEIVESVVFRAVRDQFLRQAIEDARYMLEVTDPHGYNYPVGRNTIAVLQTQQEI